MSKNPSEISKIRVLLVALVDIMQQHGIEVNQIDVTIQDENNEFLDDGTPLLKMVNDALNHLEKIDPNKNAVVSNSPEEKSNEQQSTKRYV